MQCLPPMGGAFTFYGITTGHNHTTFPGTDTILKISLTCDSAYALLARKGEGIVRIFFGP
jgi:hypothetical protein